MKSKIIVLSVLILSLLGSGAVQASGNLSTEKDGKRITQSYTFTAEEPDAKADEMFPESIEEDGKAYSLKDIQYEVLSEEKNPVVEEKEVSKVVETDIIPGDAGDYTPEETIEEDGVTYVFESMKKSGEDKIQSVSSYTDYEDAVSESDVPSTKKVTVKNEVNGNEETVSCKLTGVEKLATGKWVNSYIDITFISYDSEIFEWRGHRISKDTSYPLEGYESEVLASVGADANTWKITKIAWNGKAYDSNGVLCRNARASVRKYVNYYRANYAGEINCGSAYKVTYKGTVQEESETQFDTSYEILAKATYEHHISAAVVAAGIGIALLVIFVVAALYILTRQKKESKDSNTEE